MIAATEMQTPVAGLLDRPPEEDRERWWRLGMMVTANAGLAATVARVVMSSAEAAIAGQE